jgi:thioredoxin reductase
MPVNSEVAIVGAGPYGLSLAAHLRTHGVPFRIFGMPMHFWLTQMPKGMHLKSDGFASNLYDPEGSFTLKRFCAENGLKYDDTANPVPLDTFTRYGLAFQKKFVFDLQHNNVNHIESIGDGFSLKLDNSETVTARRVVVAAGISYFKQIPPALSQLPSEFLSHSCEHHDLSAFAKRNVTVVGGGASATDLAGLLHDAKATVQLIVREPSLVFHDHSGDKPRPLWQRLRHPSSGIGPGLRARFYCDAPWLFHRLPQDLRLLIVRRTLGPAGGWFMKDKVLGHVQLLLGAAPVAAEVRNNKVHLKLRSADGADHELVTEHVIAATGYRVDVDRLVFLAPDLLSRLATVEKTPILSADFQSSVPGLYFAGAVTANSFGPVMRFAFGARFTAPHLAKALARSFSVSADYRAAAFSHQASAPPHTGGLP